MPHEQHEDKLLHAVEHVTRDVLALGAGRPVRVGIDGFCAAGKTTFAAHLALALTGVGRPVIRATADDFQNPPEVRYQLGPTSAEGFYRHAIDFESLRRELLEPLGPGGTRQYRTSTYDIRTLRPNPSAVRTAELDAVAVVDGLFLHVPKLRWCWEYSIFVHAAPELCIDRALRRNQEKQADLKQLEHTYRTRYVPGFELYVAEVEPRALASYNFHNG